MTPVVQRDREQTEFALLSQSIKLGGASGLKGRLAG
jgi:hypothetical protein